MAFKYLFVQSSLTISYAKRHFVSCSFSGMKAGIPDYVAGIRRAGHQPQRPRNTGKIAALLKPKSNNP